MDTNSITTNKPNAIYLDLGDATQQSLASQLLKETQLQVSCHLDADKIMNDTHSYQDSCHITYFVDGRGLSCPQPLLKTKLGLRELPNGRCLYLVATDANSVQDMQAFASQQKLILYYFNVSDLHHFLLSFNQNRLE